MFDCECGYGEGKADERAAENKKERKTWRAFVEDIAAQGLDSKHARRVLVCIDMVLT